MHPFPSFAPALCPSLQLDSVSGQTGTERTFGTHNKAIPEGWLVSYAKYRRYTYPLAIITERIISGNPIFRKRMKEIG